ncbi:MAG: cytochrome c oxidase subunit II [Gammaproteobacteria bacterium]
MHRGVTPISHDVYHLHMLIFFICVIIGFGVFAVMFYSIYKHRKSKGHEAAQFHENTAVEFAWTIIPFLILVGMAVPAAKTLVNMYDDSDPALTIKVTGYQWKWRYTYLDSGIDFFSNLSTPAAEIENKAPKDKHYLLEVDHPVVVPVNKKIRFLITSNDVIHSWWVPYFGMKMDAIPGFVNEMWAKIDKPGTYRGQCAELCGRGHAFMPIVVKAVSDSDYQAWVSAQEAQMKKAASASDKDLGKTQLMAMGKKNYDQHCAACHQANGAGVPGTFPPMVQGHAFNASPAMTKHLKEYGFLDASNKIVMGPVKNHIHIVLNGVPGTAMPPWGPQLSDVDIASIITYERNAWGNDTGDVVQPKQIKAARQIKEAKK